MTSNMCIAVSARGSQARLSGPWTVSEISRRAGSRSYVQPCRATAMPISNDKPTSGPKTSMQLRRGKMAAEETEARRLYSAFVIKRLRELTNHESGSHATGIARHSGLADLWASQSQGEL